MDVRFIQGPNDWDADVVDDFFRFLTSNLPLVTDGDRMRWKLTKNGDFTIRSYYYKLNGSSSVAFPWKGIWKVKAPRRVSFFVWIAAWDRILMGDNLWFRFFDFVDWCIMCCCCGEIVNHLLLPCGKGERLIGCGALSLEFLRFHGSPHVRCQIFYLVGGIGWRSIHLTYGI